MCVSAMNAMYGCIRGKLIVHACLCLCLCLAGLSFLNWTDDQFKLMCCLAGCDYVKKIRNVGIVTAHKFVHKFKTFVKTTDALMSSKYEGIDREYVLQVISGENFTHQIKSNYKNNEEGV